MQRPSDDPSSAALLSKTQRELATNQSYQSSLELGLADLSLAESTLSEAGQLLQRAREISLAAANGSATPAMRDAAALEIAGIRDALLGVANTQGVSGYIFAGSQSQQEAFDSSYQFQGDAFEPKIKSGPSTEVVIRASGARAFTSVGGRDLFQDLNDLETALLANDGVAITASLGALEAGREQLVQERARTGMNMNRVEQAQNLLGSQQMSQESLQATLAGADPAESISRLVEMQNAMQRALAVSRQLLDLDSLSRF
ncbi:MAG: hypothetical protein MK135_05400 [Polyangiaceae bacterium]|nr:hypothetical protein [Polyangiaceae bacterium]